ncbi:MAG: phosphatidylglycerophosphatase A [Phycisphaerales bacterium]|nr:phosphatidylglycerophosphatase A [Planctomycetota bacterium]MBL6997154.1 phosphatidylglycerophosphatase A [Phycisphaerales bacterium]
MNNWLKLMWCTAGGLGLLPKAPGTWGSLKPLIVVLVCGHFGILQGWLIGILVAIIIASSITTIYLFPWYSKYFESSDPPQVVSDEAAGQSIALLGMAWLEPGNHISPAIWIGLAFYAFALFRLFDIWKPEIIDKSQHLSKGWGVLMDDILAGFFAGILVLIAAILLG